MSFFDGRKTSISIKLNKNTNIKKKYILNLLLSVINVSVQTVAMVEGLLKLAFED